MLGVYGPSCGRRFVTTAAGSATFAVPALCYCIHNNLWYVAVANLDPVTIAVTMQLKIVFAAIFARLMLGQKVGLVRAVAILLLMAGLSLLQAVHLGHEFGSSASVPRRTSTPAADLAEKSGLAAMVGVCLLSGFAGVFTERLLKDRDRHSTLWTRNVRVPTAALEDPSSAHCTRALTHAQVQMALFSMPFAVLILLADADHVRRRGLWHGFNAWLFATIGLGALGGLAVSFVFRYADNILKAFAVGLSIALNGVISVWLFSVQLSGYSIVGIALVACASILYNAPSLCWCSLEGCLTESEYERLPLVMVSSVPAISKDASQPEHGHSSSHARHERKAPPLPGLLACATAR